MLSAAILLGCMSTAAFAAGVSIIMPADGAVISGDSIITQISAQTEADYAIEMCIRDRRADIFRLRRIIRRDLLRMLLHCNWRQAVRILKFLRLCIRT